MENVKKGLTISYIVEANSANYGESFGNYQALKKMSRGDGNYYTYISRQALRYNMVNQLQWDNTEIAVEGKGGVVQFAPTATIDKYPEIDLFGYMKTNKAKKGENDKAEKGGASTRNAVARLSNAVSLEPFNSDTDFLTNMGLSSRANVENNISQSEIHKSYYAYTMTIDLDLVGIDKNDKIELDDSEKSKRVINLLNVTKTLYRDIKGRRENLSPVFVVGGVYAIKCPFFENKLKVTKNKLNCDIVNSVKEIAGENTCMGYMTGSFDNQQEIMSLKPSSVNGFFAEIQKQVENYYKN